jgi:hypothetical protein
MKEGVLMEKEKSKKEKTIPVKVCADQVVRRLHDLETWIKWALVLLVIGVVVSPVSYFGAIPGLVGLMILGFKFNQIRMEKAKIITKYGLR